MPTAQQNPLRIGMVGGGNDAFIGAVHRHALRLDGNCELVCGALSSTHERAQASGKVLGLAPERIYNTWQDMLSEEAKLPADQRMEAVSIVTPNHMHKPVAIAAIKSGFHVISDKPATISLNEAKEIQTVLGENPAVKYALTHTYLGYPMVRQARDLAVSGKLGTLRKVYVEYTQGWLSESIEGEQKQAGWRTDPSRSGPSGCMGDIGSHAHNLAEYITGSPFTEVRAWLQAVVPGRGLDDDGMVFFKQDNGITGVLTASQVCAGEENMLRIRVYGEKGGLDWCQEEPNTLMVKYADGRQERHRAGLNLSDEAARISRTPSGHPEGYLEAFATLYSDFAKTLRGEGDYYVPAIDEALRGMTFIERVVQSSAHDGAWVDMKY